MQLWNNAKLDKLGSRHKNKEVSLAPKAQKTNIMKKKSSMGPPKNNKIRNALNRMFTRRLNVASQQSYANLNDAKEAKRHLDRQS